MDGFLRFHRKIALQGARQPVEWVLFALLWPLSIIYGIVGLLRRKFYEWHWCSSYRAAIPVLSVGNLVAGGTGKTPVVDWLVKEALRQGKNPAIVSRGYGGSYAGKVGVVSAGEGLLLDATQAGDEPVLLARRNPRVPVLIAAKRAVGVKLAEEQFAVDLVILDDGFQHFAVQRDLDLVLLDAKRPYGNGWPLPAGLLREFPGALNRADLLLLTRSDETADFVTQIPLFRSQHSLADYAVCLEGKQLNFLEFGQKKLFAFAGIADAGSFFTALVELGLKIEGMLALPDHSEYTPVVVESLNKAAQGCDGLITTEKDGVKLSAKMFTVSCYQVPMDIKIENSDQFRAELNRRLWRKENERTS